MVQKITAKSWHGELKEIVPIEYEIGDTFYSSGDDFAHLDGKPFTLIEVLEEESDEITAEYLPMFRIEVEGHTFCAFPDEIEFDSPHRQ